MAEQLPPLLGLEAFEVAARYENFAAAATELSVSQATISHRIRSLEAHLGHKLFERLPRGVELTARGRAYLPAVRDAFEQVLGSTAGVFGESKNTKLTLRAPVAYNTLWLPPFIDRFMQAHPNIEVTATSSIFTAMLSAEDVDLEMWLGSGSWPGYENQLLFEDPYIALASPATAASLGHSPGIELVLAQPVVHLIGTDDHWGNLAELHGERRTPHPQDTRVDSAIVAFGHAIASARVTLAPKRLSGPFIKRGELIQILPDEIDATESLYLTVPQRDTRAKAEAVLFRDWLVDEAARAVA